MKTSVTNPNLVVTSGLVFSSHLGISYDAGATWFELNLVDCGISDLAITPTKVIVTCRIGPAKVLDL